MSRAVSGLLLALAAAGPLVAAAAPAADTLPLARQVNAQIVHRQMREEVQAFTQAFDGSTMQPADLPAACQAQMHEAVTGMYAAMVRHLQSGVDDPDYQRAFEARLAAAYSRDQLQAFLARGDQGDLAALAGEVLSAPGLKQAQDAQQQKILDSMDDGAPTDPALADALKTARAANAACDTLRMAAP